MKDPNLIEGYSLEPIKPFYRQVPRPPEGWPDRTTNQALKKAADIAHKNDETLRRANNDLLRQIDAQRGRIENLWVAIYALIAAIGLTVIGLLIDALLR